MFVGCDTDLMRELVDRMDDGGRRLGTVQRALDAALRPEPWTGPDAETFRASAGDAARALDSAIDLLLRRADELERQADDQDETSQAEAPGDSSASSGPGNAQAFLGGLPWPGGDDGDQRRDSRTTGGDPETLPSDDAEAEAQWNAGHPNGPSWDEWMARYREGPPRRPDITWDDDFPFDSKHGQGDADDYSSWLEWGAKLRGAQLLRPDLDDALALYEHYRDATGTPMTIDYEEGYREDPSIRQNVDASIRESQLAAQRMIEQGGTDFSFTGPSRGEDAYPETENWQKTLGGYQQWNSGDVEVDENGHATMIVTVHAEDRYNFNADQSDISTGTPDDVNGRFSELGWAQGFDVSGSVVRVVEWDVDDPSSMTVRER